MNRFVFTALFVAFASTAYAQTEEDVTNDVVTESTEPVPPPTVTFTDLTDAAPGVCYDSANSEQVGNQLLIGVHSGTNPATWMNTACIASTAAFHVKQMSDTISLRVNAPDGFYISRLTFSQNGNATAYRLAQVFAGAQWVVDGHAAMASIDGAIADMAGSCKTSVGVSFSVFLGAKMVSTPGTASASVTNPTLTVELRPLAEDCP